MQLKYFLLICAIIPSISWAQHIENSLTKITFNGEKKSICDWIRDDKDKEFGKTWIITTTTNQPPFVQTGTVKTLDPDDFSRIATGFSFYCNNIRMDKNINYGAIVINPKQHHFDPKDAKIIYMSIKNAYVEKELRERQVKSIGAVPLDDINQYAQPIQQPLKRSSSSKKK